MKTYIVTSTSTHSAKTFEFDQREDAIAFASKKAAKAVNPYVVLEYCGESENKLYYIAIWSTRMRSRTQPVKYAFFK